MNPKPSRSLAGYSYCPGHTVYKLVVSLKSFTDFCVLFLFFRDMIVVGS